MTAATPVPPDLLIIAGNARSLVANRGRLIAELKTRGRRVAAAVPLADWRPEVEQLGIDLHPIGLRRSTTNPLADLRLLAELRALMCRLQPRAVLGYTAKPVIYGSIAARLAGVPRVYAMITGLGHAFISAEQGRDGLRRVVSALYRTGLSRCDRVFFQNPDDQQEFIAAGILREPEKATRIHGSGVDLAYYSRQPLPTGAPLFLFIGRLLTEKGIGEFVAAARSLRGRWPEARFVAVGPHDPSLPHAVTAAEIRDWQAEGSVEFVGGVVDVRPWLAACSALVLPSYREGTPRAVLEAMSTGRAVITTDAPGCRETVVDGCNGFLVPPRDAGALAAAMEQLLAGPALLDVMGAESRRRAGERYDVDQVNQVLIEAMGL